MHNKNKKKIAIVVNSSWYAYNMRFNLALAFKDAGYEVVFISPYDKYSEKIKQEFEYIDIFLNTKGTNPIEDIKTIYRYYKIYKKLKPDIVLQYTIKPNIYGTLAASMLNIPTINNIAGLGTLFIKQNFITKIAKWLYKVSQKRAAKVFFQNNDDFKMFVDEKLVDENKCDVLPGSGVDLNKFLPVEKKDNGVLKFLLIARLLKDKGISEYIEAIRIIKNRYQDIEFQILGAVGVANKTAITKDELEKWIDDDLIDYLGVTDNVQDVIANCDCVVLPSYREGTPRSLLEACAMAKPIIATDAVGCRDVVDDEINGYLCEVRNSKDLADKMEMMINLSENKRKTMGQAGREKIVKEFDEKIVINKYLESIKEILN